MKWKSIKPFSSIFLVEGHSSPHCVFPISIAILSLFFTFFIHEYNIHALRIEAPSKLEPIYDWVKTADDAAYLRPAENYYHKAVWRDNNAGFQSYFLRTPGYGLFRYSLMKLMGFEQSYHYFKYIQLLLFSFSVLLLYYIALYVGLPPLYAFIIEAVYGLSPFAIGFLYYSITESITPAWVIIYVFFLWRGYRFQKPIYFMLAALAMAYIGLTRPVLLLWAGALPLAIWQSQRALSNARKSFLLVLCTVIILSPLAMWLYRSSTLAHRYVGLYPIYFIQSNSQFRPTHAAIWDFQKSFGKTGAAFHAEMVPLWQATIHGDTSAIHIDSILLACPPFVQQAIGPQRLRNSYLLYRQSIAQQRHYYPLGTAMPDTLSAIEQQVISDFNNYTYLIYSQHWFWCHVVVPIQLFKSLSFHSNLSLHIFQHTLRGRWWVEAMRYFFLLLHLLCCLSFIGVIFLSKEKLIQWLFGFTVGAYIFYLCYFFRGLEERYTLPILPLMMVGLAICINQLLAYQKPSS